MNNKRPNGDGSIFFDNSKGKWKGLIAVGYYDNGRVKRKAVFGDTKTEVKQKLKQIELAIATDEYIDESTVTIYMLAKQMQDDKLNYNEIKQSTYFRNMETLKILAPIYSTPLQRATQTQLKDFLLNQQIYSESVLKKVYAMLKAVFKEAQKRNIIKHNPMDDVRRPKSTKQTERKRAFTVDEQARFIKALTENDIPYTNEMLVSMFTGMRMGEVTALKVKDINLNFKTISVCRTMSKGAKGKAIESTSTKTFAGTRTLPMTPDVERIFLELLQFKTDREEYIFTTAAGNPLTTNQINMQFKRVTDKFDIIDHTVKGSLSLHSLRHTYATRCIEAGMQPKVLQTLLGHTDIRITLNTYCDAFNSFQSENIAKVNDYMQNLGLTVSA